MPRRRRRAASARWRPRGFRVVDVNLTLRRAPAPLPRVADSPSVARAAAHRDAVLDIAADRLSALRASTSIPRIPDDAAAAIKRDWAAAVLDGRAGGAACWWRSRATSRVGFLAAAARGGAAVIDLIAVDAPSAERGAGGALVAALAEGGARPVEVGTQAANVGALRFYERLGLPCVDSRYVLHLHVEPPE